MLPVAFVAPGVAPSGVLVRRQLLPGCRVTAEAVGRRRPGVARLRMSSSSAASPGAATAPTETRLASVGLVGLAVMGQNLALNIASKGFSIAVFNRSVAKTDDTVLRAKEEGLDDRLSGYPTMAEFVASLERPRKVIMLVKAGAPVDATISSLLDHLEEGDLIIDGGNEWYENTERRAKEVQAKGINYMGMGVSGWEEGARFGPSLMPGGSKASWEGMQPILSKIAAQVNDGPCVTYIGPGGAGNYVKMIHNGIEYGDMQLIGEAYDVLRTIGGMSNAEISKIFEQWNAAELDSFLIEITSKILATPDDIAGSGDLVDKVLDQTGSKGTGMWTIQEAARRAVPVPTMAASLDGRYLSSLKEQRVAASKILTGPDTPTSSDPGLVDDVRRALYASKICSYAQGMNLIRQTGEENDWSLDLGEIARIWKGGCIIRAAFLDRIKAAYGKDEKLASLLVDPDFAQELAAAQTSWRRIVSLAVGAGIAVPALSGSLAYYDSYRRECLPSSQLVQAQRDFFGAHTYRRLDREGVFHTRWSSDGVSSET